MTAAYWSDLQIAPTADVDQIRRAYARRLKAIDVDDDPAAFIALRESLAAALRQALPSPADAPQPAITEPDAEPPPSQAEAAPKSRPDDAGDEPDFARFVTLERLLFGPDDPHPEALAAVIRDILDHPGMERIDHEDRVEEWLARVLYEAVPRSDPVIGIVAHHFQWDARSQQWNQPPIFDALLDRAVVAQNLAGLADPGHRFHRAYLDLISAKPTLGLERFTRDRDVALLLSAIRRECPMIEGALNAERVALWDRAADGQIEPRQVSGQPWLVVGLAVMPYVFILALVCRPGYHWGARVGAAMWAVILALFIVAGPPQNGLAPGPFAQVEADFGPLLISVTGYDMQHLTQSNPRLRAELGEVWHRARLAGQSREGRGDAVLRTLDEFSRNALRGGSDDLRLEHWRLRADQLRWLQGQSDDDCSRTMSRSNEQLPEFPQTLAARARTAFVRTLLIDVAPTPATASEGFDIPDTVARAGADHAGLSLDQFRTALTSGGNAAQRCAARIGLIEAVLAMPAGPRAQMLRNMSAGL